MPITIHNRSGKTIYTSETASDLREAVAQGIASGVDLSGARLRNADLQGASLSYTDLHGADLQGASLSYTDLHGADLHGADLSDTDLHGARLRNADLSGARLRGACLRGVDLRDANLCDADLRDAELSGARLREAKLTVAIPIIPGIHRAVLAAIQAPGNALEMTMFHTCKTTHCRAGWVVHLAGPAGKALEERCGTALAAALIYQASDPGMERVPDYHCGNAEAMADIVACAEREAAAAAASVT